MPDPTYDRMKWANAISKRPSLEGAVAEAIEQAESFLKVPADLAIVFISSAYASEFPRLMPLLRERLAAPHLLGCSGGGVIGMRQGRPEEIEGEPAFSLTLAYLPGVDLKTFHISTEELPDLDSPPNTWTDLIGVCPSKNPQFILLSDPFSFKVNDLLQGLDFAYPTATKIGGLSSTGAFGGSTGLFCDYRFYREGTVGLVLSGNLVLEAIVAQGCRPIGQPYRVTAGEQNVMLELEEQDAANMSGTGKTRTPLEALHRLLQDLSDEDRALAQQSLFVGVARNEFKLQLEHGDFLIRNLLGVDPRVGAIAIGDKVRPGQRIQFHLRDAKASAEDLQMLLERYQGQFPAQVASAGALMFSCLGRGEGLYGEPNFDSHLFSRYLGHLPLSGFFCNGEIGPISGSTFLHGYTSVFGICRQP